MYEINYNGRTSYVSNCFYRTRSKGLLHDAERDLSAIAKFIVPTPKGWVSYPVNSGEFGPL